MIETVEQIRERVAKAQINYESNTKKLDDILSAERGHVFKAPYSGDVVALVSGGLDSAVMLDYLMDNWAARVHPLFIKRGARAEKHEEAAFDYFMDFYRERFPSLLGESVKISYQVPPAEFKQDLPESYAITVGHPMRNSTMLNLATMYAVSLESKGVHARTVLYGATGDDNTEPELGPLSMRAQTLSTCIQTGDWEWQITSPFTEPELGDPWYKTDIIQYAADRGIPLEKTRTCFGSDEKADGTCLACVKRKDAFKALGMEDKVVYDE